MMRDPIQLTPSRSASYVNPQSPELVNRSSKNSSFYGPNILQEMPFDKNTKSFFSSEMKNGAGTGAKHKYGLMDKIKAGARNGYEFFTAINKVDRERAAFDRGFRKAFLREMTNGTSHSEEEAQAKATAVVEAKSLIKEERKTASEKNPLSRTIWIKDSLKHPRFDDAKSPADFYHAGTLPILTVVGREFSSPEYMRFQEISDTAWMNEKSAYVQSQKDEFEEALMSQKLDSLQEFYKSAYEDAYKEARITKNESASEALWSAHKSAVAAVHGTLREPTYCNNAFDFKILVSRFSLEFGKLGPASIENKKPLLVQPESPSAEKESTALESSSSTAPRDQNETDRIENDGAAGKSKNKLMRFFGNMLKKSHASEPENGRKLSRNVKISGPTNFQHLEEVSLALDGLSLSENRSIDPHSASHPSSGAPVEVPARKLSEAEMDYRMATNPLGPISEPPPLPLSLPPDALTEESTAKESDSNMKSYWLDGKFVEQTRF
jgi:hypothetical protein